MTQTPIQGIGHTVRRKEDPRFVRGRGTYVDDIKLPNMLYLDIVRSPYAHARIVRIDATRALAMPGVLAVITGKDLEAAGLAWMPTLMSDRQMVLPTDRVVYYAQEVAAVLATDRYLAADAVLAVDVEYEPLEAVVDPIKALQPGSPPGPTRPRAEDEPHLALGGRRQGGNRPCLRRGRGRRQPGPLYPAHPRVLDRDLRLRRQPRPGAR
jgi:CO/xanthine dehydrogenase Mo-binding subunit